LQLFTELSALRELYFNTLKTIDISTAWMNTMFEETEVLVWILAFRITDYSFWKYDQHNNFHRKNVIWTSKTL